MNPMTPLANGSIEVGPQKPVQPPPPETDKPLRFPLSIEQRRLWTLHQMEPDIPGYSMPFYLLLAGELNLDALQKTLTEMVRRNEILRTRFPMHEGEPVQEVGPAEPVILRQVDLSHLDVEERQRAAKRMRQDESDRPFNLQHDSLFRLCLVRLSEREHELLITLHHIVCDGLSLAIVGHELQAIYTAFYYGRPSPLPEHEIQYGDYAAWQQGYLRSPEIEEQLKYWSEKLAGLPILEVPPDRMGTSPRGTREQSLFFELPADLCNRVEDWGKSQSATVFHCLLAAFQWLLSRYCGQEDVALGVISGNRNQVETENLIGPFLNTLVLRTDVSGAPSYAELVGRARDGMMEALRNQEVPFEGVLEHLAPARTAGHSPFFQVMLSFEKGSADPIRMPSLQVTEDLELRPPLPSLILVVEMKQGVNGAVRGVLSYKPELFALERMERLVRHLELLMDRTVATPNAPLTEIEYIGPQERRAVLSEWNRTESPLPTERRFYRLFEEHAEMAPNAVAASFETQQWTYSELNRRANRLAHYLMRQGVGPEVLVGIFLERGLEMLVGLLGIVKAGGAYLPLDPSFPADRLAYMLADSGAPVLLTSRKLASMLSGYAGRILALDELFSEIAAESDGNLALQPYAENPAYVIYTSGSAGKPKGVLIRHAALHNVLLSIQKAPGLSSGDQLLAVTTLSFDIATLEMFAPLISGAKLLILSRDAAADGERLIRELNNGITVLQATPATYRLLLEAGWRGTVGLKALCGGEALPPDLAKNVAERCQLWNLYGPTEATIWSILTKIGAVEGWVPIGHPLDNTTVYVLDCEMNPVPLGVTGEMYLGGEGLARGYWTRPGLTAERFIPDPFGAKPGARMYRTGDLVRRLANGDIEYLGRIDDQVKIRGYRIEPGEVEAALLESGLAAEAAVVAREDRQGEKCLVAFVVPKQESVVVADLRSAIKGKLPEYMLPAAIVFLPKLPRTGSGKINRKALPAIDKQDMVPEREYVAPRTPAEVAVAAVWARILGREQVGAEDDFFKLGGHSLLATRVISQIRSELGVEIELRTIFERRTLAGFAEAVNSKMTIGAEPQSSIPRAVSSGSAPLSYAQRRLWFTQQLQPESAAYSSPFGMRMTGPLDVSRLERSLSEMVRRHEVLRTTFPTGANGDPELWVHDPEPVRLPILDLSELSAEAAALCVQKVRREEAEHVFDLSTGPLYRFKLLRLGGDVHEFLVNFHHIVSDGWSLGIFGKELSALWDAFAAGQHSPLPELQLQYSDYATWQCERLETEVLAKDLPYWRQQLDGVAVLDLPTDFPRPAITTHQGQELHFQLSCEVGVRLAEWARGQGATTFMALLAAFQWLLGLYSGQDDIAVGSVIANRTREEIEGLFGFFVNSLVLRTDISGRPSFRELLQRVREVTLGAYAHQELPFEKLVEELNPERDFQRSPLFQVRFAMDTEFAQERKMAGLDVQGFDVELAQVKFDLTLAVETAKDGSISGCLVFAADLFQRQTMEQFIKRYCALVAAVLENPERSLPQVAFADAPDLRLATDIWNKTRKSFNGTRCLHSLIDEQARKHPEATALVFEDQSLSYAALDERANRLARLLQERGVGPEVRVGIFLERSLDLVVALLGVLRAGAAYVPLDPSYPGERIAFLLEDAGIPVLISSAPLLSKLPSLWLQTICMDTDWPLIEQQSGKQLGETANAKNLAYLIYTSGSTGKPKAVGIEHRQLTHYVKAAVDKMQCEPGWRFAWLSTVAADLGNTILFGSLCSGGELHIVSDDRSRDARQLQPYLRERKIDCMKLTPSHLLSLQALGDSSELLPRRLLVLGGEASRWEWVEELDAANLACRILNHYGPTECAVGAIAWNFDPGAKLGNSNIPLGTPLANVRIYVLNAEGLPLPAGMAGELAIGGEGVARGYIGHPALTAERFVPDPFAKEIGARLYRTGDKARWRSDGLIEFLGRIDNQFKIRGYRVEPGEIESVLNGHPNVLHSAVALQGDAAAQKLIGYVSLREGAAPAPRKNLYALPNGMSIVHQNNVETDYLYREIFESRVYLQHGIEVPTDACVFDVGANIGLFTLFAVEQAPQGRIYAFEPIRPLFEKLKANAAPYKNVVTVFQMGMAEADRTAEFAYFPRYSMMSGMSFYSDVDLEIGVIKRILENRVREGNRDAEILSAQPSDFLNERFQREEEICTLRRLSSLIAELEVEYIDLLKIDVQRAELDVLRGIDDADWERIAQIVMEAHDGWSAKTEGRLREIVRLLESRGFEVTAMQYGELEGTDRWNVYARNPKIISRRPVTRSWQTKSQDSEGKTTAFEAYASEDLRTFLKDRLPDYMVPARVMVLPHIPLTKNGKLDRRALPPVKDEVDTTESYVPARNPIEETLCSIWSQVLSVGRVGIHDDFFVLGGHSLLATQVVSRIQNSIEVEVPLTAIFRSPTVAGLAGEIERIRTEQPELVIPRIAALARQSFLAPQLTK